MANKKVNNPCIGSGSPATEDLGHHWLDKRSGATKTPCPECRNLVTISKSTKKLRLHESGYKLEPYEMEEI
jgi:hypothetical protein